jgi:murein DD-endopeptidase MepM/ murein hydrolase activator NlpD
MKKKLSVFIVPDSGEVRQFSISRTLLITAISAIFTYAIITVFFSYGFFSSRIEAHKIDSLTKENEFLTAKIVGISESIDFLHDEIATLTEKEKAIRTIFELPEIDPQQRQLGIGGPNILPQEEELAPSRSGVYQSEAEVDRLVALTNFEKEQFNFVYDALLTKKTDLDHTPSIMPTKGYLMRGFGMKRDPFTGEIKLHSGLDISNVIGTHVFVTANGVVEKTEITNGLGNTVIVDHGNGYKTVYGHLSAYKVRPGDKVVRGQLIALMGNTGYSTGPHLHYEVLRGGVAVNPMQNVITYSGNF